MLYSLYAPMWDANDTLRKLLKEVLGYTDDEIKKMESEYFGRNIVNNLTIDQAKEITAIFLDNDFGLYLNDGTGDEEVIYWKELGIIGGNDFSVYLNDGRGSEGTIAWNQLGIHLIDELPKDHYCDEPLVSRDHLADLSIPKKIDPPIKETLFHTKPIVECPYCHSTDTRKISGLSKAGSVALFGIFSLGKTTKQWHCNRCNSDF